MCVRKMAPIYNKSIANIIAGVNIKLSRNIHVPNLYGITIGKTHIRQKKVGAPIEGLKIHTWLKQLFMQTQTN